MKRWLKTLFLVVLVLITLLATNILPAIPEIATLNRSGSVVILSRDGEVLRETLAKSGGRRLNVPLSQISKDFTQILLHTEDRYFYFHSGVNVFSLARALWQWVSTGHVVSGGSTITMQLARMLNQGERDLGNKSKEILMALVLELSLSKREILETYINNLPFANELYGIAEASAVYFKKSPKDLSLPESAYLLAMIRAPSVYNPYKNNDEILVLKNRILDSYFKSLNWDTGQILALGDESIRIYPLTRRFLAPHFTDFVLGKSPSGRVQTSLDLELTEEVQRLIMDQLALLEERQVAQASALVIKNDTGEILAYVGSRDYWDDRFQGMIDGVQQRRQPGSALKPFTYARALDRGLGANHVLPDVRQSYPSEIGDYLPENYDRKWRGPVLMRTALSNSLNAPAVQLLREIGIEELYRVLSALGFAGLQEQPAYYGLGLTLGNVEVSLFELVRAYSVFARRGITCDLTFLKQDSQGNCLGLEKKLHQIFTPSSVAVVRDFLSDRQARKMVFGASSPLDFDFPVMVKTGTSQNYRDNWTVAVTPEYTVGVWAGNFNADPMRDVSGVTGAAPLAHHIVEYLYRQRKWSGWDRRDEPAKMKVCALSGQRPTTLCPHTRWEFVRADQDLEDCGFHSERVIDLRNHLLAGQECPDIFLQPRGFLNLPAVYDEWQLQNLPQTIAPSRYSDLCPVMARQQLATETKGIRILSPQDGAVYKIDHHRPLDAQYLSLRTMPGVLDQEITLDGRVITQEDAAMIRLVKGPHQLTISDQQTQVVLATVRFQVR